ncbi:hypothetical protein AWC38_SpisGene16185 [Stylophora pistillata]|uniref:Uncharacterized protein n=1 Tax=Stylophora pistillata TaxID=50429 RepID=A0A2B4RRH6_STYPI|nr:hypothetical protein AWC38_SpisGene16185 [Stylophora pistillata]
MPAAIIYENASRPLKTLSPEKAPFSLNEIFEKLQNKIRGRKLRPGVFGIVKSYNWRESNEKNIGKAKVLSTTSNGEESGSIRFENYSSHSTNYTDYFKARPFDLPFERDSARNVKDISTTAPISDKKSLDLDFVEIIQSGPQDSFVPHQFQDFRRQWLRQRRARVDWQKMIQPCVDNMAWGQVKNHWVKLNRTNAVTSEVIFWDIKPAREFSKIFIQSKTSDNRTKMIGGDTWRVYLRGPSSIAATLFDHNNGTYEALFLIMEPGIYQLMINLDYSLCDGFRDPPSDWFIKGNAQGKYQKDGLLGLLDDYLIQPFQNGNPIIINVPESKLNISLIEHLRKDLDSCSYTCNHLWDGFGRWENNEWIPFLDDSYHWSMPRQYQSAGFLWIYGDSLAVRLVSSVQSRALCSRLYWGCGRSYNWIYPVISEALSKQQNDDLDFSSEKVIETIKDVLRRREMQRRDSVLLLNLGIHFPISVNFSTFQRLVGDLINVLKETRINSQGDRVPKYPAKVIWKSSTAIHKEKAEVKNKTNWRFFTTQVST